MARFVSEENRIDVVRKYRRDSRVRVDLLAGLLKPYLEGEKVVIEKKSKLQYLLYLEKFRGKTLKEIRSFNFDLTDGHREFRNIKAAKVDTLR